MIVCCKLFSYAVSHDHTNGEAVVPHHLSETVECRRFHLEVAHAHALIVEGLYLVVVLRVREILHIFIAVVCM